MTPSLSMVSRAKLLRYGQKLPPMPTTGKRSSLPVLHQRHNLEGPVKCAEAAWHNHERRGVNRQSYDQWGMRLFG